MAKTLNRILSLGMIGLAGLTAGCFSAIKVSYEGHSIEAKFWIGNNKFPLELYIYSNESKEGHFGTEQGYVQFIDLNKDEVFDAIKLIKVRKGDEIEKYACLPMGEEILQSLNSQVKLYDSQGEQK